MSELVPENMREIRLAMLDMQDQGKPIDEHALIAQTVEQLFQIFIDNAEAGHYDTCKLVNDHTFQITDIFGQQVHTFTSGELSFVDWFKKDAQDLQFQLEDWAIETAK